MGIYLNTRIKQLEADIKVYKSLDGSYGEQVDMLRARILECELALGYYNSVCRD